MDRWKGCVAVVTGASSGIGRKLVDKLLAHGMKVAGLARRCEKPVEEAVGEGSFHPIPCDLRNEGDIVAAFKAIETNIGPVSVLVNNAGLLYNEPIIDGKTDTFRSLLDVNVLAVAICTREASQSMRRHRLAGHIVNVNSIAGHDAARIKSTVSLYCASKYALAGVTESLRNELFNSQPSIKVSSISPGTVRTDMVRVAFDMPRDYFESAPYLEPEDVADAIVYILGAPPHVQVNELILKHVREP